MAKSKKKQVSAPIDQTKKDSVWITPEADREVAKIGTQFFLMMIILLTVVFGGMMIFYHFVPVSNNTASILDVISALIIFIPFFAGARRSFRRLKQIGKDLLAKKQSLAAIQALEPFTRFGNRNFDTDGEAHMLLMMAYIDQNRWNEAEKTLYFLEKYRKRYDASLMARHVYDEVMTRWKKSQKNST